MVAAALPDTRDEQMTILFSLDTPPDKEADLEQRVANGEVISPAELEKNYAPDPGERDKLITWLKSQNFDVADVSPDGTSVYARSSVAQIEKTLGVDMVSVTKDGVTYTAAKNAPSLPADVGAGVHAIIGLQPFRQARKQSRIFLPLNDNRALLGVRSPRPRGAQARRARAMRPAAAQPTVNIDNAPPYVVPEILKAYGADGLGLSGKGQTIAILIDTVPNSADLRAFWAQNGVPNSRTRVQKVNVTGQPLPPASGEETLDVSWASGVAPEAKVRVYATGTLQFVDLDRALDQIIADLADHPGMRQLSISLGLGEKFMGGPQGEVRTQHMKFLRLAAAGVNVFVSSGDAGSKPDDTGHSATGPTQAEYESSDSMVVGVGGTTLKLTAAGAVKSEVAWTSSGGGTSIFFDRPAWQKGPGLPAGTKRLVPDVALAADPNTGAFLVLNGRVTQIGGTSWSAPVWAGFCALLNEARAKAGKPPLPFLNPLLYPLKGTACFRDIVSGTNGDFQANAGYDQVTGLGVPNVKELVKALS
jgi:kumamolisin